ncbi:hypothetical protein HIM_01552 [Hirsutella minnesotensis 3608]|nr:hypothetical protein HIM_01552 [Hirsutella minnesotensis 3608]
MKVDTFAVTAALVAGAMASTADVDKISVSSVTAAQLGSMTEQQTATICKLLNLKGLCKAYCKRDLSQTSYTQHIEAAEGTQTLCKICILKSGKACGDEDYTPPDDGPCEPGDTRPKCQQTTYPPQPGDRRPQCQQTTYPRPCQPGDRRPQCQQTTYPRPCQPGDRRPQCQQTTYPRPCQPGDRRPQCQQTTYPRPCQPGDRRPQCQQTTYPRPCQPGDSRPKCQTHTTYPPTTNPGTNYEPDSPY